MEDMEFDAAIKDMDETIVVMTQVIDNIKALEHEKNHDNFQFSDIIGQGW